MCSWYEVGGEFLLKHWPSKNRFTSLWKRLIRDFTVSTAHVRNSLLGNFENSTLNCCENQIFLNYFHSKVFFLILVQVCFTFPKHVTIIECLCKYSNHCLFSWIWNIFLILLRTYLLENNGRNIVLCVKMLLWKKNRMC